VLAEVASAWTFLVKITPVQLKMDRAAWNATVASLSTTTTVPSGWLPGKALAVCVELNLTQYFQLKDMTALAFKVDGLAGGKGVSKTVLPEQIKFFLNDELGSSRQVITLSTCPKQFQLHLLRRFLGAGFLNHVQDIELFKEVFCIVTDESKTRSIAWTHDSAWERKNIMRLPQDLALSSTTCQKLLQIGWN
jgi:hypothetical protein